VEVVDEEADRRARRDRGEHAGGVLLQVEGDHRERRGGDRADAGGEPVDAVGEVDDVHDPDEPEQREHVAGRAELDTADERQRDHIDRHAREHQHERRRDLAGELGRRPELAPVVERADRRDQRRAGEDALDLVGHRQEQQPRDERAGEDREPAEQRRRVARQPALLDGVDRADAAREPCAQRRQDRRDDQRDEEAEQGVVLHGAREDRRAPGAGRRAAPLRRRRRRSGARRAGSGRRSP
jgi:hypothetical protein